MLTIHYQTSYKQNIYRCIGILKFILPFSLVAMALLWCSFTNPFFIIKPLYETFPLPYARTLSMIIHGILGGISGLSIGLLAGFPVSFLLMRNKLKEPPVDIELSLTEEGVRYHTSKTEFHYKWETLATIMKLNKSIMMQWTIPGHSTCICIPSTAFEEQNIDEFYSCVKAFQKSAKEMKV